METKNEGIDNGILCKWKSKENWSSDTPIRQNRHENKDCYKRKRRALYHDQGLNPRFNNLK